MSRETTPLLAGAPSSVVVNVAETVADPLHLQSFKKPTTDVSALKRSGSRGRKIAEFYEAQNELIDDLLHSLSPHDEEAEQAKLFRLQLAINCSVAGNVFLMALQLYAALTSNSLSLFATMADAFMDLASSIVLLIAAHAASKQNRHEYPTGKMRLETAGIIVFASLMATVSFQLMAESMKTLIAKNHEVDVDMASLSCVGVALVLKACLYMFCSSLSEYPSAAVLATDHRNDIIVNFFGIAASLLGKYYLWWIDPVGGLLIALVILHSWTETAWEHIQKIIGQSAEPAFLKKIIYISLTHDPRILQIDTCFAYHSGDNYFVEVDIVLPRTMTLEDAHDIGESLQMKLEGLKVVDRAFVHLDFESSHKPEHSRP
ncbi:cation efflux family-domain-containing protein [Polychytrium aggregatum]|uniref:cation efflux family-domain-containing protein n=1 Tax=Polychytrium aggregatum TaxID=110093 RepID=UPI0022FEF6DD|nr:cation efflux family-domain-containing protein [Polychytrium aggregatum]KAI9193145.1 cation efflux family-domain-containing protein [Polychytrium aggregatum]